MNAADHQYKQLLHDLVDFGVERTGRNGITRSLFGAQMRFDLMNGFPLLTTKQVNFKAIVVELLWFLRGDTNIDYLHRHGVRIWDQWADENGDLGPVYGSQWRSWRGKPKRVQVYERSPSNPGPGFIVDEWETIDQIRNVLASLSKDPAGRRHVVSAWNPDEVDAMALPPCHCLFQFYVAAGRLSCHLYQRSADWFIGVPFNVASYALLTVLMARELRFEPGEFIHSFGDYHLYGEHLPLALEQLRRSPRDLPEVHISGAASLFELEPEDITLEGYRPHPAVKAKAAA